MILINYISQCNCLSRRQYPAVNNQMSKNRIYGLTQEKQSGTELNTERKVCYRQSQVNEHSTPEPIKRSMISVVLKYALSYYSSNFA